MVLNYSVYEAKARFSEVIRQVREGKTVTVSYRGEPVAEIRPIRRRQTPTLDERLNDLERNGLPGSLRHPEADIPAGRAAARRTFEIFRRARRMSVAYVDTSVLTAIAFDEPGAAAYAQRLDEFARLISSNQLEAELRAAFARENLLFHDRKIMWCDIRASYGIFDSICAKVTNHAEDSVLHADNGSCFTTNDPPCRATSAACSARAGSSSPPRKPCRRLASDAARSWMPPSGFSAARRC